jgi:dsRNA-specific ribonuclease
MSDTQYTDDVSENTINEYIRPEALKPLHQEHDVVYENDELIYDPYNPINQKITIGEVNRILKVYGIPDTIHNFNLYRRAFVHQSYVERNDLKEQIKIADKPEECMPLRSKSNERLEFLGDGVLELVVKYYLYRRFPRANEGFMTEKKISIVKNETIGRIAYDMGLSKWILLSKGMEEKGMRTNMKKLGCLFEAFVGAIFLDFNKIKIQDKDGGFGTSDDDECFFVCGPGFHMAQRFIECVLDKHLDWDCILRKDENYKNILQVYIQQAFSVTPVYRILHKEDGIFRMGVFLCLGQEHYSLLSNQAEDFSNYKNIESIQEKYKQSDEILENLVEIQTNTPQEWNMKKWKPAWIFLGEGEHRVKKKAEQLACYSALEKLKN